MPQPAKATLAAGATRLGERLLAQAIDRRIAIGVLFLALCAWKFTFGLEYVVDLRLGDETKYLGMATGYLSGPLAPEWSPLYVYFYKLEHLFAHDPVRLFYLHQKILATLLPISFFLLLAARSVPFVAALASAAYLMIAIANLPVGPKTLHLGLSIMFLAMAAFVRLGGHPGRWGLLIAVCGVLSLVRAEYLIPLGGIFLYACWLAFAAGRPNRTLLAWITGGVLAVAALFAAFGSPLFGGRSVFAFAQHFALNYAAWHKLNQDPWTADYWAIFHHAFGDAGSIPAAFLANPAAFLHHLLSNLAHAPIVFAGLFFGHYNLLLPRYKLFTLVEAGIFALALAAYLGHRLRAGGWKPAWPARLPAIPADIVCLLLFLVPFAVMILVLYPRNHYVLAFGAIAASLAIIAAAPHLRAPALNGRALLALPLLFAIVPSVGSLGARVDMVPGEADIDPRPALATVEYLRSLHITAPAVICQSQMPGVGAYLGRNFDEVEEEQKTQSFRDFVAGRGISIVVADDRMRHDPRFLGDPQWRQFQDDPASFGFAAHAMPDEADVVVYVAERLLRR